MNQGIKNGNNRKTLGMNPPVQYFPTELTSHCPKDIGNKKNNMYKIPEDFDVLILKSETVSQIVCGLNFISLFVNNGFVQFSGSFSFSSSGKSWTYDEAYPVKSDLGLLSLLEKK